MVNLKQKTISGIKWQVINKVAQKALSVITFAVLARILEPAQFGLFALAFVLIDGLSLFQSLGLDAGIVQKKEATNEVYNTAFFIIQAMGFSVFTICYFAAPLGAAFFGYPALESIIKVLGAIFIINSMGKVSYAILNKSMNFRVLSLVQFFGSVINTCVAITLALKTGSVWSLVWAYLAKQTFVTLAVWQQSHYRFQMQFNSAIAKDLFRFGKYLVGVNILGYLGNHSANIIVGKILGATSLGFFLLAINISNFINTHFSYLIAEVLFPAYSKMQHDTSAIQRMYLKVIKFVSSISMIYAMLLISLAGLIVHTIYGAKWISIVPLIQILGLMQLISPITSCSPPLWNGMGHARLTFRMNLLGLLVRLFFLVGGVMLWGLYGAASALLVSTFIMSPINLVFAKRVAKFSLRDFLCQVWVPFVSGTVMGLLLLSLQVFFPMLFDASDSILHNAVSLLFLSSLGITAYYLTSWFLDRSHVIETKDLIKSAILRPLLNKNQIGRSVPSI